MDLWAYKEVVFKKLDFMSCFSKVPYDAPPQKKKKIKSKISFLDKHKTDIAFISKTSGYAP